MDSRDESPPGDAPGGEPLAHGAEQDEAGRARPAPIAGFLEDPPIDPLVEKGKFVVRVGWITVACGLAATALLAAAFGDRVYISSTGYPTLPIVAFAVTRIVALIGLGIAVAGYRWSQLEPAMKLFWRSWFEDYPATPFDRQTLVGSERRPAGGDERTGGWELGAQRAAARGRDPSADDLPSFIERLPKGVRSSLFSLSIGALGLSLLVALGGGVGTSVALGLHHAMATIMAVVAIIVPRRDTRLFGAGVLVVCFDSNYFVLQAVMGGMFGPGRMGGVFYLGVFWLFAFLGGAFAWGFGQAIWPHRPDRDL